MNTTPKTLHIVLNGVTEDSRVLKCAWSLGNAGWDVLVAGASPTKDSDEFSIGYARILRLPLKPVITQDFLAKLLRRARYLKRRLEARFAAERLPGIPNYARAIKHLTPVALNFRPDVIHAHDYTALPIAGALVDLLKRDGHECKLIYDAHEYVPGVSHLNTPLANIYSHEERRLTRTAASILSVSEGMSDLLVPHLEISHRPELVANDPLVEGAKPSTRNLRKDCGINESAPLMVYSGAVAPQRGVHTAAAALRLMPDLHLVVIANPKNATVLALQEEFKDVADRFHVQPYVPNSELVSYLSTATVGLIPILHRLNHEISLITKFGEYMQAKLPILVSDVKTMAAEVRRLGIGEVHIADDVNDFIRAARLIIDNPRKYSDLYTPAILAERSWEKQAEHLLEIYNRIAKAAPEARTHRAFEVTKPVSQAHQ